MQPDEYRDDGYGHRIPRGVQSKMVSQAEVPVIDFAPMLTGGETGKLETARRLREACIETGFFYLQNHGVPQHVIDEAFAEAGAFFRLPLLEKMEIFQAKTPGYPGFTPMGLDSGDPMARKRQEGFNMNLELPLDTLKEPRDRSFHQPNLWPSRPERFRACIERYFAAMEHLKRKLFSAFALALNLPEAFFEAELTAPFANMRVNHYAPQPEAELDTDIGGRPHTDFACFTILAQESEIPALQLVCKDGTWATVPPMAGAFNVNIGDQFERWTNNLFASTMHRVINENPRSRLSIAYFAGTNFNTQVSALRGTVGMNDSPAYAPITSGQYVLDRLAGAYDERSIKERI